jgi:hypothetical protein
MPEVYHAKSLSMGFCLDCHRAPEKHLRPLEEVFNLDYTAKNYVEANPEFQKAVFGELYSTADSEEKVQHVVGTFLKNHWDIQPKESCATCHR